MRRTFLAVYFATTGWVPLLYGIYLANEGQFIVSIIVLLVSFCGFRLVYDIFNYQEKIESQRKKLAETARELEKRDKTIGKLYKDRYED